MEPYDRNTGRESPARARATVSKRRLAMRMIRDPLHGMVLVYQLEAAAGDSEPPALVMESGTWCARLREYPPNWRELKDDELLQLRRTDVEQPMT